MTAEHASNTKQSYPSVDANPDFASIETRILADWKAKGTFEASVNNRPANNEYVFYDGPPFANGLPHYGHLLTGYVKDLFARYHTMLGQRTERRFGWDCHGLPAEMGAEKELGVSGRANIEKFGIQKFNDYCRTSVMKYTGEWEEYVTRQARWVDFANDYKTMDTPYMESVMWAFSQLHKKGLVYESHRVMPYSWAMETPVSNFETRMDNSYREREDKAITVAFKLRDKPKGAPEAEEYYVLAWTTTPWTLPSNLALAVKADMEYVAVLTEGKEPSPSGRGLGEGAHKTEHARALRKNCTDAEKKLWSILRNRNLETYKFRRQETIGHYIVDFACWEKRLVIEIDGGQHADQEEYDNKRTKFLGSKGFQVIRFWNNEVLQNTEGVIEKILDALNNPHPNPLPEGEGVKCYILEKNTALGRYSNELGGIKFELNGGLYNEHKVLEGSELIGLSYEPLFPYFKDHPNSFRILDGSDFIEEGSGTGIVHMAPGFGEDDQRVCAANGIDLVVPVDERGRYTDAIFEHDGLALAGLNVVADTAKNADEPYTDKQLTQYGLANLRIITHLKGQGRLIKQEDYRHNYPHCWRTDTPLIYRALPSWYVEVSKFAPRMVELNEQINWIPDHIKHGRFGKWLEGARDWSISRNRYWGSPIPVWKNDKDDEIKVFGSIAELEAFFGVEVKDLHRPFIDELVKEEGGKTWRRVTDVFDCWFESGSMPYAQVHYPFENKEWFETHFPADFIVEYEAQTRGWFYTLMVLSTALFDKPPFKNCICHGVVMSNEKDENGHYHKLSKRLKNYPDPMKVFGEYGADALRWFMMSSPVMRGSEMYIDKEGKFIRDSVRLYIKPIWNAYNFFTLYANADEVKAKYSFDSQNGMDRYILSKLTHAVKQVKTSLDAYDTPGACQAVTAFFEDLNNWYIRRNKERFWSAEHTADKQAAYDTLYTVLHVMSRTVSPLLPLISDEIYRGLTSEESVHLADFPQPDYAEDQSLMESMDFVREVCNAALAVRNKQNIRVRQPLSKLTIVASDKDAAAGLFDIVKDEINVKEVSLDSNVADLKAFAEIKTQVNLPVVGKKLGPAVKAVMAAARNGEWKQVGSTLELAGVTLQEGEYTIMLDPKPEYKDSAQALSSNDALVILDLKVTPELEAEGVARDVVRLIQQSRKDADLDVSAHIDLKLELPEHVAKAVNIHAAYICEQTLADSLHIGTATDAKYAFEHKLDEHTVVVALSLAKAAA